MRFSVSPLYLAPRLHIGRSIAQKTSLPHTRNSTAQNECDASERSWKSMWSINGPPPLPDFPLTVRREEFTFHLITHLIAAQAHSESRREAWKPRNAFLSLFNEFFSDFRRMRSSTNASAHRLNMHQYVNGGWAALSIELDDFIMQHNWMESFYVLRI